MMSSLPESDTRPVQNGRMSSTTESMQANAAPPPTETTPLTSGGPNKQYLNDENLANNLQEVRESLEDSRGHSKTPPPKSKLRGQPSPPRNIPPGATNVSPGTTHVPPGARNVPPAGSRGSRGEDTGYSIEVEGGPINDEVDAPRDRNDLNEDPPEDPPLNKRWFVCKLSCCLVTTPIVLVGVVMVIVWTVSISVSHDLPNGQTVPTGLLQINPGNTVTHGGATVTVNMTNATFGLSDIKVKSYYGPVLPKNKSVSTTRVSLNITINQTKYEEYRTEPLVFQMGSENGSVRFETVRPTDLRISIFALTSPNQPLDDKACELPRPDDENTYEYQYNTTFQSCPNTPNADSNYGLNRYFVFQLCNSGSDQNCLPFNTTLTSLIVASSSGALETQSVNNNCAMNVKAKTAQCDIQYDLFVEEVIADNYILIMTQNSTDPGRHNRAFVEYSQVLTVSSTETIRTDIYALFVVIPAVLLIGCLAVFLSRKCWKLAKDNHQRVRDRGRHLYEALH